MVEILLKILAILVILIAAFILFIVIERDYLATKIYKNATRTNATILSEMGKQKTANYGLTQSATVYYAYQVEYHVNGCAYRGIYLSKKQQALGQMVEIRYRVTPEGVPDIVNSNIADRFQRFKFAAGIGLVLGLVLVYLSVKGVI